MLQICVLLCGGAYTAVSPIKSTRDFFLGVLLALSLIGVYGCGQFQHWNERQAAAEIQSFDLSIAIARVTGKEQGYDEFHARYRTQLREVERITERQRKWITNHPEWPAIQPTGTTGLASASSQVGER